MHQTCVCSTARVLSFRFFDIMADENDAAAKIQAAKKGNEVRNQAAVKKSKVWQALNRDSVDDLKAALEAAAPADLTLSDGERTPLRAALEESKYECAKALLGHDAALGVGEVELAVWQRFLADKKLAASEDAEDPPDVTSEEYIPGLAAQFFPDANPTEAMHTVRAIVTIGVYIGGRADVDSEEYPNGKSFDLQVGARSGSGISLSPDGDVYVGEYAAG